MTRSMILGVVALAAGCGLWAGAFQAPAEAGMFVEKVTNHSSQTITVWTGEKCCGADSNGYYQLAPGATTPSGMDADHVRDTRGQWWKVGLRHCEVFSDRVEDCTCRTSGPNRSCS